MLMSALGTVSIDRPGMSLWGRQELIAGMKTENNAKRKTENPFMAGGFIRYYSTRNPYKITAKNYRIKLSQKIPYKILHKKSL